MARSWQHSGMSNAIESPESIFHYLFSGRLVKIWSLVLTFSVARLSSGETLESCWGETGGDWGAEDPQQRMSATEKECVKTRQQQAPSPVLLVTNMLLFLPALSGRMIWRCWGTKTAATLDNVQTSPGQVGMRGAEPVMRGGGSLVTWHDNNCKAQLYN